MDQSDKSGSADRAFGDTRPAEVHLLSTHLTDFCRRGLRRVGVDVTRADGTLWGLLSSLFRMRQINCVIDVGAHYGEYGRRLRSMGYSGHIRSFEPVPDSFKILKQTVAHDPKWNIYESALGRAHGTQRVNITSHSVFSSFLTPSEFSAAEYPGHTTVIGTEDVPMATLDGVFENCVKDIESPRVFLKLDTQGYDLEVLAGAAVSISKIEGMQSEVSLLHCYRGMTAFGDAVAALQSSDFYLSGIFPVGRTPDLRLVEVDCVLVRTDADSRC